MPYDEEQPPTPRRPALSKPAIAVIAIVAVITVTLAGRMVWQAMTGPSPEPSGSATRATPATPATPASPPSGSSPAAPPTPSTKAPSATPGTTASAKPLAGKVVAVDPGHNPGNFAHSREINRSVNIGTNRKECDTTGTSTNAGYTEAEFTLDVSHRLVSLLRAKGATVVLTQDRDRPFGPCIDERARIGNAAHADAAVSIHADGSAVGNHGFHVILPALVKGGAADTSKIVGPSRALGERIAGRFTLATRSAPANYVGGRTGLDTREDLGGLNLSTVPKVFIECGNMRDPEDAALMTNAAWRQKAAQGIADGISTYLLG